MAAWNYFMSVDTDTNDSFIEDWHAYIKDDKRVTNDPMEASYIGFKIWVEAVEKAGTTDPAKVSETPGLVAGDAWPDFLPGSKDLIADWRAPLSCGNYNVKTAKCSGQNF